jgi:predicted aldo/keto reductase-like oxidoreductase
MLIETPAWAGVSNASGEAKCLQERQEPGMLPVWLGPVERSSRRREAMGAERKQRGVTRREFLRRVAAGAAFGLGAGSGVASGVARGADAAAGEAAAAVPARRELGKSGLTVFPLGLGCIQLRNPGVVHRALDLGVNYFDTAEGYQHGNSEMRLGRALKGRREEAIVATKFGPWNKETTEEFVEACEDSLKRLDMDHVDVIHIHGPESVEQVMSDAAWEAFGRLKEGGKARFFGVSIHENVDLIEAAIGSGRFDVILTMYNALNGERIGPLVRKAKEAGIGVVGMKSLTPAVEGRGTEALAGLRGNPYQQSLQWVVKDENVSTVIVEMKNFDELNEGYEAATTLPAEAEQAAFEQAVGRLALGTCHMCGACTGQCARGVQVAKIMRYRLYYEGYGDRARAVSEYRALPAGGTAAACGECDRCRVVCPWGVAVRERMVRTHAQLA